MKIVVALDIDGTITDHYSGVSDEVLSTFCALHREGVTFAFVTGRSFQWGMQVLQRLEIPYYLAIHNGALLLEMPGERLLTKNELSPASLQEMEAICCEEPTDFVIYSGYSGGDLCYYRPAHFESSLLSYLHRRSAALKEEWHCVADFAGLPLASFASLKCFGRKESAERISRAIEERLSLHAPINKDPFDNGYYVIQVTQNGVDKGMAVEKVREQVKSPSFVIAAGDDHNDIALLKSADFSIAMETAPAALLDMADLIAPSAEKSGIVEGLNRALAICRERLRA